MLRLEELNDEELVKKAQTAPEGDRRAFELLVRRHQAKVLANCRYLSRSAADAEDLSQEVFVKVFFHLGRFEGRSKFSTWLQKIKVNHCLNFLAKKKRRILVDIEDQKLQNAEELSVGASAERDLGSKRTRVRIEEVLDSMSDTLRVPLVLRDADGLSYQEIAEVLNIGLSAVKMRIKRAREEFRSLYGKPF